MCPKQLVKILMSKFSHPPMPPITITVKGVDMLLTGLNPNKAQGPDEISPWMLNKELHTDIAPILTIIFQRSPDTGMDSSTIS